MQPDSNPLPFDKKVSALPLSQVGKITFKSMGILDNFFYIKIGI